MFFLWKTPVPDWINKTVNLNEKIAEVVRNYRVNYDKECKDFTDKKIELEFAICQSKLFYKVMEVPLALSCLKNV